jgi:hypothetical protein
MDEYKAQLDRILLDGDYTGVHFYTVLLSTIPDVLSSGGIYPEFDFFGCSLF